MQYKYYSPSCELSVRRRRRNFLRGTPIIVLTSYCAFVHLTEDANGHRFPLRAYEAKININRLSWLPGRTQLQIRARE